MKEKMEMNLTWIKIEDKMPPIDKKAGNWWRGGKTTIFVLGWEICCIPVACFYSYKEKAWIPYASNSPIQISHWMPLIEGPEENEG